VSSVGRLMKRLKRTVGQVVHRKLTHSHHLTRSSTFILRPAHHVVPYGIQPVRAYEALSIVSDNVQHKTSLSLFAVSAPTSTRLKHPSTSTITTASILV
jgi:hypothetical protein